MCGLHKPEECIRSLGAGGTDACEQPDLGARNQLRSSRKATISSAQVSVVEGVVQCFSQEYGSLGLNPSILGGGVIVTEH